jgi:hypothetical protein
MRDEPLDLKASYAKGKRPVINNPFQMVVLIVLITMIAGVLKARYSYRSREATPRDEAESIRMREEIKMLRDRLAVLERITIEKESSLEREIEQLRDRA